MYESESEKEHSESEFYYPEDTISGDEGVFNATDENQKNEAPVPQKSLEEIYRKCHITNFLLTSFARSVQRNFVPQSFLGAVYMIPLCRDATRCESILMY